MKTLACGEIMQGCPATFAGETEDEVLAQAGKHAVEAHGLEVTPEVVTLVRSHIRDTLDTPVAAPAE
jgi:predicted small metal-binding protein